ncbi:hypothetical protein V4890_16665 [Ralstonia solanacearum species complex bacterium KE056]|uniref:hypothetical protein n=1 Tax=Ralstonia solanacearum species complex bacterium KE056 TaxID=3119585 RepID=UPI002FC3451C
MRDTGRDRGNEDDQHTLQGDPPHRTQRSRAVSMPIIVLLCAPLAATAENTVETESRINALRADRLPTVITTGNSKTRSPAAPVS